MFLHMPEADAYEFDPARLRIEAQGEGYGSAVTSRKSCRICTCNAARGCTTSRWVCYQRESSGGPRIG